jgi:hypothetical protein
MKLCCELGSDAGLRCPICQPEGLAEISRGQRPRYQRHLASRPGGAPEYSPSSMLICGRQSHPPFKNGILRNKPILKNKNANKINRILKPCAMMTLKTNPSQANIKAIRKLWTLEASDSGLEIAAAVHGGRPQGPKIKLNKTKKYKRGQKIKPNKTWSVVPLYRALDDRMKGRSNGRAG